MSDHEEKNHPIAGYIAAVILGGLVVLLLSAMSSIPAASLAVPFVVGWAILSLYLFTRKGSADSH